MFLICQISTGLVLAVTGTSPVRYTGNQVWSNNDIYNEAEFFETSLIEEQLSGAVGTKTYTPSSGLVALSTPQGRQARGRAIAKTFMRMKADRLLRAGDTNGALIVLNQLGGI